MKELLNLEELFNGDLLYFKRSYDITIICFTNEKRYSYHSIHYLINIMLKRYLKTYEGYIMGIREHCSIQKMIPISINESVLLVPIYGMRHHKECVVNWNKVYEITQDKIIFISGKQLDISYTKNKIKHLQKRISIITNYKYK